MVSCPHGLGTVRTGVRPLMSSVRGKQVNLARAKSAPSIWRRRCTNITRSNARRHPRAIRVRAVHTGYFAAASAALLMTGDRAILERDRVAFPFEATLMAFRPITTACLGLSVGVPFGVASGQ